MTTPFAFAIDGLSLTGDDGYGCDWKVAEVVGWFTGAVVRGASEPRAQQNGDRRGTQYRAGRVVTLRGTVRAPDVAALEQAGRRLASVLSHGGFGELVGESANGPLSSRVQLDETPQFDLLSADLASWQVTVGSEDPALYGPLVFGSAGLSDTVGAGRTWPRAWSRDWGVPAGVTPGAVSVRNEGTAPYFPVLQIDGPVTNPVVTLAETGDRIAYRGTVAAGQFLQVDCGQREVLLGARSQPEQAVSRRHLVSSVGSWLAVPVGGGTVVWSADAGTSGANLNVWSREGAWS